jgi:pSer/pThr/pTyr-binding forkhead associated (FHA) protein
MSFRLVVKRHGRNPQVFRLLQPAVVIGRGKGTDLLLPDISVSRHHARVDKVGDGHRVVDLGSQNGTKVNGDLVTECMLNAGDELQVGKFVLSYEFKQSRKIEDSMKDTASSYSLEGERTGFLKKVSAVEGEMAHNTTMLSEVDFDEVRRDARTLEFGRIVAVVGEGEWLIGKDGLLFGKGGIQIAGTGIGGAVRVVWNGINHEVNKSGGLFFTVTVNDEPIKDSVVLQPNDTLGFGKSQFIYQV